MDPRPDLLALGQVLRLARERLGLTQAQLGEEAGVNDRTIMRLELGRHAATVDTLWDIAAALRTPLSQLVAEAELGIDDD